jgi:hypothetical protein
MAVEVSSYEEFLVDRHGTNLAIKIFSKLPLGALAKTILRGIDTDHIQSRISNYQSDQDNPVVLPPNINDSILKAPIDQDAYIIPTRCCPCVPKFEASILHLLRLLACPFSLLNS